MELSVVEIDATKRLLDKMQEKMTEKVQPGAYDGKITLNVDYSLVKAAASETSPQFKSGDYIIKAILLYASKLDSNKKNPKESLEWLSQIFGDKGVMGLVIRDALSKKPQMVIPDLIEKAMKSHLDQCKITFQSLAGKEPKQGNTNVSGVVSKVDTPAKKAKSTKV